MNKYLFKEKKQLFLCFVDFSKAFDAVWRPALLYKILRKEIGGNLFNINKHMYPTTKRAFRLRNLCSDFFYNTVGVNRAKIYVRLYLIPLLMILKVTLIM